MLKNSIHLKSCSNYGFETVDLFAPEENISFTIVENKVTALVGKSGSGKTTLLKLLLKFYEPASGTIEIGGTKLKNISNHSWRNYCGVVMQEGFIFDDTVRNN